MNTIQQEILSQKILPLYNSNNIEMMKQLLQQCYAAGLRCFEFTNRSEAAADVFYELAKYCRTDLPGMQLGAGTIKTRTDAELFTSAGAAFLVSPCIPEELIRYTAKKDICWIPGCATATEIAMAEWAGLRLVKIFPANLLGGTAFLKSMKDVFPAMKFLATGGVQAEKAEVDHWLHNGADAVGLGSSLFNGADISEVIKKIKQIV